MVQSVVLNLASHENATQQVEGVLVIGVNPLGFRDVFWWSVLQNEYPIKWVHKDMDAAWLAPHRLLMCNPIGSTKMRGSSLASQWLIKLSYVQVPLHFTSRSEHA